MPQYIKSLELQGYKTFANRVRFEFSEAITSIVGPNGAGKSNIVDALRWVLGEQSFGLLRGKRTMDMIFSGSDQRPRSGMAMVTVTLDNSDAWLPIDFSEVAITRRAYRDGQNEYLLNGQKVRLRDVTELLARVGLSERSYTIIGQGLVDTTLYLRPEERRRLFEEAAGIGLQRSRREETLRRLEATRRNLERVQDILAELKPRLDSLERQAERARQFEQAQADLRVLLRDWYGYHWHRAQKELVHIQEFAKERSAALETARNRQDQLAQAMNRQREEVQRIRTCLNDWHRQLAQLHTRQGEVNRDLAVLAERLRSTQETNRNTQDELALLTEEIDALSLRLEEVTREVEVHQTELLEGRDQLDNANQTLSERQQERGRAEQALQNAQNELTIQRAKKDQLQARLIERQEQLKRQQDNLSSIAGRVESAQNDLHHCQKSLETAAQALHNARVARQKAEEAWRAHQQKLTETEQSRQEAQARLASIQAEAARARAQLDVIQQAEQALAGYSSGAKLLLEAAGQAKLSGVKGALIAHLEVPPELEVAIAAALGEYLNAILLEAENTSVEALDLLTEQPVRAALLPLKSLIPAKPIQAPQDEACFGVAADLVQATPELRQAVDLLLGSVLVVRDRKAARRLLASAAPNVRAVTLQGEVFHASGPILANREGETSLLSRPRQRRELADRLSALEKQQTREEEEIKRLESQIVVLKTQGGILEKELAAARQREVEASSAQQHAALAVEQAERQLGWLNEQYQSLEANIVEMETQTRQMEAELVVVETDITICQETLRERQLALARLPLDEFQEQVSYWTMQCAILERTLTESQNRRRESQLTLERACETKDRLEARLKDLQISQASLEADWAGKRELEEGIASQITTIQEQIAPAEAELAAAEERLTHLQKDDDACRQSLSRAEHHYAQASIALARQQEAVDSMRRKIEDDFGLVSFEYADEISGPKPLPLAGLVENLPLVTELPADLEENLKHQRSLVRRMGPINPEAQQEYQQVKERYNFLMEQMADLEQASADIRQLIAELDSLMQSQFEKTFAVVSQEFSSIFTRLFGGGTARLILTAPDDPTNTGIDIEVRLPGRRTQGLSLLSGGERSLASVSLVFALLKASPTPFCVLDEVDAMLDEANVGRFGELLRELSANTQILIITHNRNTVQVADIIYGITMGRDSTSQVLSLRLDQVAELVSVE